MTTPQAMSLPIKSAVSGTGSSPQGSPLPAFLNQLGEVLTRQAALLIDMIIPGASHVYRPTVLLSNSETASTDGSLWIRMPVDFLGLNYPKERVAAAPVWLGLLAHEFGHWLQPLDEMERTTQALHVPFWLANLLLDIHGEALVAGLFPLLLAPLTATRSHIGRLMAVEYKRELEKTASFLEALQLFTLYFRYCYKPYRSYGYYSPLPRGPSMKLKAPAAARVRACAESIGKVVDVPARELPGFLERLAAQYPELVLPEAESFDHTDGHGQSRDPQKDPSAGVPGGGMEHGGSSTSSGGSILPALQRMIDGRVPPVTPSQAEKAGSSPQEFVGAPIGLFPPPAEAVRLANQLTVRFQTPKGSLSVPAPGRLDRRAALHRDPLPFRLEVPSRFSAQPSPKVVLHVDHSGSMGLVKWAEALQAAQAIALAIRRVGGDVRVSLFEGDFHHAPDYSAEALFCREVAGLSMDSADGNNTSFAWLPVVWMKFPDHLHILLTDGEGDLPLLIPERDRRRTFAIVIPDGRPDVVAPVAAKVVIVNDLARLPGVFSYLAPRQWVA